MRIYLIRNNINNKIYIGQTTSSVETRFKQHKKQLRDGNHGNAHLQSAWNKYGEDCWSVELLTECSSLEEMNEKERLLIQEYNSIDRNFGYNIREGGDGGGRHSDETKEKLREATELQWERDRLKLNAIRKAQWTDEYKEKMRTIMQEKWSTFEYAEKQNTSRKSESNREKLRAAAARNKSKKSAHMRSVWNDPERRKVMVESIKKSNTPEVNKQRSDSSKARYSNSEVKKRHSETMKHVLSNPEIRDKMSKSLAKYFGRVEGPDGKIYDVVGLRRFCREHNLVYNAFRSLKFNPNKTYKGWKFLHEDNH